MAESLSFRAYAKHRGVSHPAVLRALREGRIEANFNGKIDPARADRQWAENTRPRPALRTGSPTIVESSRRLLAAKASREKLRLQEERGRLVRADEVRKFLTRSASIVRDRLRSLPPRLAPELAMKDSRDIEARLESAIREVCTYLARPDSYRAPPIHPTRTGKVEPTDASAEPPP